jgi:hypothetical protein
MHFLSSNFVAFSSDYLSDERFSVASSNRIDNFDESCGPLPFLGLYNITGTASSFSEVAYPSNVFTTDSKVYFEDVIIATKKINLVQKDFKFSFSNKPGINSKRVPVGIFIKPSQVTRATITNSDVGTTHDLEPLVWNLILGDPDSSKTEITFELNDENLELEVTEPLALSYLNGVGVSKVLQRDTVVVDPQFYSMLGCLKTPLPKEGIYPDSNWAIVNLRYTDLGQSERLDVGSKYFFELQVWSLGCAINRNRTSEYWYQGTFCIYKLS